MHDEFGTAILDTNETAEPCGPAFQTKKGFIRKFIVRNDRGAQIVSVFAKHLKTLDQPDIPIRFKSDFVFAIED